MLTSTRLFVDELYLKYGIVEFRVSLNAVEWYLLGYI
jgi:hypothetical protein